MAQRGSQGHGRETLPVPSLAGGLDIAEWQGLQGLPQRHLRSLRQSLRTSTPPPSPCLPMHRGAVLKAELSFAQVSCALSRESNGSARDSLCPGGVGEEDLGGFLCDLCIPKFYPLPYIFLYSEKIKNIFKGG